MDTMAETINGYEVRTEPDGVIVISPALYGPDATALLHRYRHLDAAVERRRAATRGRDAEVRAAAEALAEAARTGRQEAADERVRACRRHRVVETRTQGWTHCVASGGGCSGRPHGGVTHVDTCRCGARRQTEANGRASGSSGWYSPRVE